MFDNMNEDEMIALINSADLEKAIDRMKDLGIEAIEKNEIMISKY